MSEEFLIKAGEGYLGILLNENRLKIIKLLKNEKLSISQIARSLGLPTASVVYHIRLLESAGIVKSEYKETRPHRFLKVYYVNKEAIKKALETIEAFIHEIKRKYEEVEEE